MCIQDWRFQATRMSAMHCRHCQYMPVSAMHCRFAVSVTADNMGMQGSKIWISNIDGTGKHVLVAGGNGFWVTNPVWSPDGRKIAYLKVINVSDQLYGVESRPEMWVVDLDGGKSKQVLGPANFHPILGYGDKQILLGSLITQSSTWTKAHFQRHATK